jgi:DNA-directed RNA polymerase, mitochondrial
MKQQNETMKQLGMDNAGALKSSMLQAWMWGWHLKLTERLDSEIKAIIKVEQGGKRKTHGATMGPFLTLLKPDRLSIITILEVMRLHGSGGVSDGMKTARALLQVGKSVEGAYRAEMCRKNNIHVPNFNHGSSTASTPTGSDHGWFSLFGYHHLHARRVTARKYMEDSEEWTSTWTQSVRVKVGSILVDSLMNVATVERTGLDKRTGEQV